MKLLLIISALLALSGCTQAKYPPTNEYINALRKNTYYPVEARKEGLEGEVKIIATINPNGEVIGTEILQSSGNTLLDTAAIRTLLSTKFPSHDDTSPRVVVFPINYKMAKKNDFGGVVQLR